MAIDLENYTPALKQGAQETVQSNLNVGGNLAVTGNTTIGGSLAVTGAITGPRTTNVVITAATGATVVLTAALSGTTYIMSASSGTPVFTLPAVAAGLEFNFITANTTEGFAVNTTTTALIHAKTANAGSAITSTATTGSIVNTQATAAVGDAISLVCDGVGWWPKSQTGTFSAT